MGCNFNMLRHYFGWRGTKHMSTMNARKEGELDCDVCLDVDIKEKEESYSEIVKQK